MGFKGLTLRLWAGFGRLRVQGEQILVHCLRSSSLSELGACTAFGGLHPAGRLKDFSPRKVQDCGCNSFDCMVTRIVRTVAGRPRARIVRKVDGLEKMF